MIEGSKSRLDILTGMLVYGRPDAYVGSEVKCVLNPSTFHVFEVGVDGDVAMPRDPGTGSVNCTGNESLKYVMCKIGVSTIEAVEAVERTLRRKVSFAGLKDAGAYTCQYITVGCRPGLVFKSEYVMLNGAVRLYFAGREVLPLRRGDLEGNVFEVVIKDGGERWYEELSRVIEDIVRLKPFPNYYGYQRFGSRRPVTHLIGRHIVRGEYEEAVKALLGSPYPGESMRSIEARKLFERGEWREALKVFPRKLRFERMVLGELLRGSSFKEALLSLGRWFLRFSIEAYQSYLFNLALSSALTELGSVEALHKRCEVFPIPEVGILDERDDCSKYAKMVLKQEGIDRDVKGASLMVKGVRETYFNTMNVRLSRLGDGVVNFRFTLKPATYATVLLREIFRDNLMLE